MGVNLELYRARVGMFRTNCLGNNHSEMINIDKTCGSLKFIKMLLVSHGIHPNPGPVVVSKMYHWKETQQTGIGLQISPLDTDVDEKVKNLHYDMVRKLGGYFSPNCGNYWDDLCVLMRKYLDYTMVYGKDIKNIGKLFEQLMAKGVILYGEYDTIVKDFKQIHVGAAEIIEDTAACIRRIRSGKRTYAEMEQQVHNNVHDIKDIKRKNQEAEQQLRRAYERRIGKMSEQHAKVITEKNQTIEKLQQRIQSKEGTISADHEQGPSNIRQRRTALNASIVT